MNKAQKLIEGIVKRKVTETKLNESSDEFFDAYVEAALWSSMDNSDENTDGEPLDKNYTYDDITPQTKERMQQDCDKFVELAGEMIENDLAQAGHDFWLTRNGHGAGFWDGDWPEDVGEKLTALAEKFGEYDLYVGDNGEIDGFGGRKVEHKGKPNKNSTERTQYVPTTSITSLIDEATIIGSDISFKPSGSNTVLKGTVKDAEFEADGEGAGYLLYNVVTDTGKKYQITKEEIIPNETEATCSRNIAQRFRGKKRKPGMKTESTGVFVDGPWLARSDFERPDKQTKTHTVVIPRYGADATEAKEACESLGYEFVKEQGKYLVYKKSMNIDELRASMKKESTQYIDIARSLIDRELSTGTDINSYLNKIYESDGEDMEVTDGDEGDQAVSPESITDIFPEDLFEGWDKVSYGDDLIKFTNPNNEDTYITVGACGLEDLEDQEGEEGDEENTDEEPSADGTLDTEFPTEAIVDTQSETDGDEDEETNDDTDGTITDSGKFCVVIQWNKDIEVEAPDKDDLDQVGASVDEEDTTFKFSGEFGSLEELNDAAPIITGMMAAISVTGGGDDDPDSGEEGDEDTDTDTETDDTEVTTESEENLTSRIKKLQKEAEAAGDTKQVALCKKAIAGNKAAIQACKKVLDSASAQESSLSSATAAIDAFLREAEGIDPTKPAKDDPKPAEGEPEGSTDSAEDMDAAVRGQAAGDYDASYKGGDWKDALAGQGDDAKNAIFKAAYLVGWYSSYEDSEVPVSDQSALTAAEKKVNPILKKAGKVTRQDESVDDDGDGGDRFEVIVGNIGSVYRGTNKKEAFKKYHAYIELSKSGSGRAGGEDVTLMVNDEPLQEYGGSNTQEESTGVGKRTEEDWWEWHDKNQDRWSETTEEAEARCAAWVAGDSDDGPDMNESTVTESHGKRIEVRWDETDRNNPGWYVEVFDEDGMTEIDSQKIWFPIDVNKYSRNNKSRLLKDIHKAFKGYEIKDLDESTVTESMNVIAFYGDDGDEPVGYYAANEVLTISIDNAMTWEGSPDKEHMDRAESMGYKVKVVTAHEAVVEDEE